MNKAGLQFADTVERRLKELGTNAYSVEQQNGLPVDAIRNVTRSTQKDGPRLSRVERICDALGLEFYIGPRRETSPIQHGEIDGKDYAAIPRRNVTASAGPGIENDNEDIIGTLAFRRDWLAQRGIAASNAVLISVMGDSMTPLIWDGDTVMVDTSRDLPTIRGRDAQGNRRSDIYALEQGGDTRIKWVERPDDKTLIIYSENMASHPPEVIVGADIEAVRIVGKVVWWGHAVS